MSNSESPKNQNHEQAEHAEQFMAKSQCGEPKADVLLRLEKLDLAYDKQAVLSDVSFTLQKGEIACILGPSGSGKTSVLRAIAGFLTPSHGNILINDTIVSSDSVNVAPSKRAIGLVFQDFALFPHLTVAKNVAFGLQKLPEQEQKERVTRYLDIMGIADLAQKYPAQLSGGQQQRVAIARAIAPQPDLLLLDEAFSSLDPILREQVAQDMRRIIKQLGLTALLVTHDQAEAFAFADVIGVVAEQRLQQFSNAYALYHEPQTMFVANFIGEGAFVSGTVCVKDNDLLLDTALGQLPLHRKNAQMLTSSEDVIAESVACSSSLVDYQNGQQVKLLLRPDDVIHDDASPIKAKVVARNFRGAFIRYQLQLPNSDESVLCFAPSHHDHDIGASFGIRAEVEHIIHFKA
jgi:iron(III) transport system ATP-binding protein